MGEVVIIESLGTTGSGKTTLVPLVIRLLRDEGWSAMSMTEAIHFYMRKTAIGHLVEVIIPNFLQGPILWRVFSYTYSNWHILSFIVKHPRLVYFVIGKQLRRPIPWSHRMILLRLYFQMAGRAHYFRKRGEPGQLIFLDEGFAHRSTHLFVSERETLDSKQVEAYLKLLPPLDLVLWIKAPIDLCYSRILARGAQLRLLHLNTPDVLKFISNAEQVCQITANFGKEAGWSIIQVDNLDNPEECACKLAREILQHIS